MESSIEMVRFERSFEETAPKPPSPILLMEKRLKVFRAHSRIFPWQSEAIDLLNRCAMVDTGYNVYIQRLLSLSN